MFTLYFQLALVFGNLPTVRVASLVAILHVKQQDFKGERKDEIQR